MQDKLIVGPAEFGKSEPKIAMRYVISLGDAQGIAPKGFVVAPVANLPIGQTSITKTTRTAVVASQAPSRSLEAPALKAQTRATNKPIKGM